MASISKVNCGASPRYLAMTMTASGFRTRRAALLAG
jgi:hypothetical protein